MHAKQEIVPSSAIRAQQKIVSCHPNISDNFANIYIDSALPTYVKKFSRPEIHETFPNLLKCPGTKEINIRFTPCMLPVIMLVKTNDKSTLDAL